MKILLFTSFFPVSDTDPLPQFIREQVLAMAEAWSESDIIVIAPQRDGLDEGLPANVKLKRYAYMPKPAMQTLSNQGIMPAIAHRWYNALLLIPLFIIQFFVLLKWCKRFKPDVIYSHWLLPQALTAHLVSSFTNTAHVFTSHSSDIKILSRVPIIGKPILRAIVKRARAATVVNQYQIEQLKAYISASDWPSVEKKVAVLPMGIRDLPSLTLPAVNERRGQQPFKHHFVFMGRLSEKKGLRTLLLAFNHVLQQLPGSGAALSIYGAGPMMTELEDIITSHNLADTVFLHGFIGGEDKQAMLTNNIYFISPSIITASGDREGQPVAVMEAMGYGMVCVVTDQSGADNLIINQENGFIARANEVKDLADVMLRLITMDDDEINNLSNAAYNRARSLQWSLLIDDYQQVLFASFATSENKVGSV